MQSLSSSFWHIETKYKLWIYCLKLHSRNQKIKHQNKLAEFSVCGFPAELGFSRTVRTVGSNRMSLSAVTGWAWCKPWAPCPSCPPSPPGDSPGQVETVPRYSPPHEPSDSALSCSWRHNPSQPVLSALCWVVVRGTKAGESN